MAKTGAGSQGDGRELPRSRHEPYGQKSEGTLRGRGELQPEVTSKMKAEFHDIGKLIDWVAVGLHEEMTPGEPHEFEHCIESVEARNNWEVVLSGSAWEAIVRKDKFREIRKSSWPDSLIWALTSFSDHLAAGYGRDIPEGQVTGTPQHSRYCLWTGKSADVSPRMESSDGLREMVLFLNRDPSWSGAVEKYGQLLLARAETARPGLNVTSLLRHCEVTGKLARVIASSNAWEELPANGTWNDAQRAAGQCNLTIAHYVIEFPQKPYRVRDLNVFRLVEETLSNLESEFPDNVLTRFENQVIVAFTEDKDIEKWNERIWEEGLLAFRKLHKRNLLEHKASGIVSFGNLGFSAVYPPDMPTTISLPICENCQMQHAAKRWPIDHDSARTDEPVEDLCGRCFSLRRRGEPLTKLANDWREGTVAWIHVPLNFDVARAELTKLHKEYLRTAASSCSAQVVDQLNATFPLIADFVEDYKSFLTELGASLRSWRGDDNVEEVSDALWCVKLESKQTVVSLVSDICAKVKEHFPKLMDGEAEMPIRVGISISNPKHPFFSHWEAVAKPEREITIHVVGSGRAAFRIRHTPKITESLKAVTSHAVHRLAAVAGISEPLAKLVMVMKDNGEGEMDMTALRRLIPDVVDFESVRTLINLTERDRSGG